MDTVTQRNASSAEELAASMATSKVKGTGGMDASQRHYGGIMKHKKRPRGQGTESELKQDEQVPPHKPSDKGNGKSHPSAAAAATTQRPEEMIPLDDDFTDF